MAIVQYFIASKLYGSITIKFEKGRIVQVRQEQITLIDN